MSRVRVSALVALAASAACGSVGPAAQVPLERAVPVAAGAPRPTILPQVTLPPLPPTSLPALTTTRPSPVTTTSSPAPAPAPAARKVHQQEWTPFATVGGVVLRHPSSRVERVGFHQANHDGARDLQPLSTAADPITMESRGQRATASRTAADVVVDPDVEIRSPVTGRVLRAGTYVLYCKHSDDYVAIEPDDHPGWSVKVLHIDGVRVRSGDRVEAGRTVLAPRATRLPFASQVDEFTAKPSWPHVHTEVIDPSIPDKPNGPGC